MTEELIQMSRTEMERLRILHRIFDHELTQKKASELMEIPVSSSRNSWPDSLRLRACWWWDTNLI